MLNSEGGVSSMNLELSDEEKTIVRHALDVYLSNLREEVAKTEKHEWKVPLHKEEDILKEVIKRLS